MISVRVPSRFFARAFVLFFQFIKKPSLILISITATSEPMNDEVKAAVSASAALPCCAIG